MCKLDDLPPEILFEVLQYLTITYNRCPTSPHPLNALASTSKHLNAVVEEHTRGLLKKHVRFTPPKHSKTFSCRKKWLAETCQFCRRNSQRRAIFYPGITCCRLCDKQRYPKMTMTQATKDHSLSKLDLFTPNTLHPALPPLTTGLTTVMGSACTMILESDVLARRTHIQALLGAGVESKGRVAAHDRIVAHMGLYYSCGNASQGGGWRRAPRLSEQALEKASKSMRSEEGRREYVRKGLEREWAAMGMGVGAEGSKGKGSREDPVDVDEWD
ncbi:hypothetical protein FB567DRAFT_513944 [Paraphoma chrysanthemicola]|uniref:F-box domain-containing protein n=1 Tax=Paraphoma chrysanthemicola TaxID=798071 RepID=A0A8K0W690_9PLEO|nr:hypothetical protein FB567DRAFT_513944 [Paraphoma chrysanthemicola]